MLGITRAGVKKLLTQLQTTLNTSVTNSFNSLKTINGISLLENGNIDTSGIGVGQTWQDVTASRSAGVTYTNTTGKPIEVKATFQVSNSIGAVRASVGGLQIEYFHLQSATSINNRFTTSFIVPNGSAYIVNVDSMHIYVSWHELR